jgi:hypothetical protein
MDTNTLIQLATVAMFDVGFSAVLFLSSGIHTQEYLEERRQLRAVTAEPALRARVEKPCPDIRDRWQILPVCRKIAGVRR